MDTSKEYVEMCDCSEIRDEWNLKAGDFFTRSQSDSVMYCLEQSEISYIKPMSFKSWIGNKIWLPRQDQLQEMINDKFPDWFDAFYLWTHTEREGVSCTSMEQLWLAFVMKEKFGKTWDGEKWQ